MEPENWLTLAATFFPQIYYKGTLVDIMLQTPFEEQKKPFVELYENATWRRDDMSFLEFLRKSNSRGEIIHWLEEKHKSYVVRQAEVEPDQPANFLRQ